MKLRRLIHPGIRKSLISFLVVFIAMATVVMLSDWYRLKAEDASNLAKREMRAWRSKIDEANRNNQILVSHENTYEALVKRSVIGEEDRLSWIEAIHRVADKRGMSSIKYDISSQELIDKKTLDRRYAGIDVFRSRMSLDMKLLHEGDLVAVLSSLRDEARGLFSVDKCDIRRLSGDRERRPGVMSKENIQAYCELSWYTLKKAQPRKR